MKTGAVKYSQLASTGRLDVNFNLAYAQHHEAVDRLMNLGPEIRRSKMLRMIALLPTFDEEAWAAVRKGNNPSKKHPDLGYTDFELAVYVIISTQNVEKTFEDRIKGFEKQASDLRKARADLSKEMSQTAHEPSSGES